MSKCSKCQNEFIPFELVAMQCAALRCTVRGLFAMQYAARGLVAFARCRRRHAFDGGIFRVGKIRGFIKPLALGWGFKFV